MTFGSKDLAELLSRTEFTLGFEEFIQIVLQEHDLGKLYSYVPILVGYEDANIRVSSEKGEYVLKIFAKDRSFIQAKGYADVLLEAEKRNLPFTKLVKGEQGYLSQVQDKKTTIFYYLAYYFNGSNFDLSTPSMQEMKDIAHVLAQFNTIQLPVVESYDSWGSKNLVREYTKYENETKDDIKRLVSPIAEGMEQLDITGFSKGLIHGDLQRKHVLKNDKGEYCILDLGCMRNDAIVYDLSIFLAWFCLAEDTWEKREEIVDAVVFEYTKPHKLSKEELASLPLLVRASYAAYLRKTDWLIQRGDASEETREWFDKSKGMLQLMSAWDWKV